MEFRRVLFRSAIRVEILSKWENMSKIKSPVHFWKTFAPYYRYIEKADSVLLNGRKWILLGSCCLPVFSLVSVNACSVLNICIATSGLIAVVASSLFEKYENTTGKSLCNKFVAYCFTSAPGLALSLELIDVDRKSTRLNSSHVKISYAVFC